MTTIVDLPNPYNVEGPWITVFTGDDADARTFVRDVLGADEEGRVSLLTIAEEDEDA